MVVSRIGREDVDRWLAALSITLVFYAPSSRLREKALAASTTLLMADCPPPDVFFIFSYSSSGTKFVKTPDISGIELSNEIVSNNSVLSITNP